MAPQGIFELLFPLRALFDQPAGSRIADPVAEDQIQPPGHLVDEVIHVALQAAVVVAGKEEPAVVVQQHPACEMDGPDARQKTAPVDMPRRVVQQQQRNLQQPQPEQARLHITQHIEMVGDIAVLLDRQARDMAAAGADHKLRVGFFQYTQAPDKIGGGDQQQRGNEQQQQGYPEHVQQVSDAPVERCGCRRREPDAARGFFQFDMGEQALPQRSAVLPPHFVHDLRQMVGERPVQRRLLVHLLHRSADPVDVVGAGFDAEQLHPLQQVAAGADEPLAVREYPAKPRTGLLGELFQKRAGIAVAVAEEDQRRLPRIGRHAIASQFARGEGFQDHEARHVQPVETPERDQFVLRVGLAETALHRAQQLAQPGHPICLDRGQNHEGRLGCHRSLSAVRIGRPPQPGSVRVSAKSRMRVLRHHTLPR